MNADLSRKYLLQHAERLGFDACRVARADFLSEEAPALDAWLAKGYHGSMAYMENHYDKRLDPRKLVPGAKSVISLAYNYFPERTSQTAKNHALRNMPTAKITTAWSKTNSSNF